MNDNMHNFYELYKLANGEYKPPRFTCSQDFIPSFIKSQPQFIKDGTPTQIRTETTLLLREPPLPIGL